MASLHETLETNLPTEQTFAFVADFANAERWDPGVAWSRPIGGGPTGVGSRYLLGVRMGSRVTEMEYRISTFEAGSRVVLNGSGSNIEAIDDIRFYPTSTGTRIDYVAEIRLAGWMRFIAPFAGLAFASIARNARDGMQRTLNAIANETAGAAKKKAA